MTGLELGHFANVQGATAQLDTLPVGADDGIWTAGFTAGAGTELKLTDHWSLRAEYRYLHFGFTRGDAQQFSSTDFVSTAQQSGSTNTYHTTADFHVGKLGIAYGF